MHPVPSNHGSVPDARRTDLDFFAPTEQTASSSTVGDPPPAPLQPPRQEPPREDPPRGGGGFGRRFLPLALVALLAGGAGAAGIAALDDGGTNTVTIRESAPAANGSSSQTRTIVQPVVSGQLSIGQIYDEAGPGVVRVEQEIGQGTGFVIYERRLHRHQRATWSRARRRSTVRLQQRRARGHRASAPTRPPTSRC